MSLFQPKIIIFLQSLRMDNKSKNVVGTALIAVTVILVLFSLSSCFRQQSSFISPLVISFTCSYTTHFGHGYRVSCAQTPFRAHLWGHVSLPLPLSGWNHMVLALLDWVCGLQSPFANCVNSTDPTVFSTYKLIGSQNKMAAAD